MLTDREMLFIDGEWVPAGADETTSIVNPATEETVARVAQASPDDVNRAVRSAANAFRNGPWRRGTVAERARILANALNRLATRSDELAGLITTQMGLPASNAAGQVSSSIEMGRYFLDVATDLPTTEIRQTSSGPAAVLREPVGVVAAIAPWNGPFAVAIQKIIPALVTGCSVVYKPALETPLDAYLVVEELTEAGVPAGVLNLITSGPGIGRALVAHPDVQKISFTGSTSTGREIGRVAGGAFKRVQLELGGKSAAVLAEDVDVELAMSGIRMGSFMNSGQVCASYSRILVPRGRADELTQALVAAAESLVVGDPADTSTTMGPVASRKQYETVSGYVDAGRSEGAVVATGGGRPSGLSRGFFVSPTVFAGATNEMRISQEEIFGPVISVISYDSLDEAIAIANDSVYGLHGAVFTQDPTVAARVAREVHTGTFSINSFTYNHEAPFGGVKDSGVGRDTGPEAVESFYELKTVNLTPEMVPVFEAAARPIDS